MNNNETESTRSQNALLFTAFAAVHERLASRDSYRVRRYLNSAFPAQLLKVARAVLGAECVERDDGQRERLSVSWIRENIQGDPERRAQFNRLLSEEDGPDADMDALEAVEKALMDCDIIAVPLFLDKKNTYAQRLSEAYRSVLLKTGEVSLPFIAIHQQLRGDPCYKDGFLELLNGLNPKSEPLRGDLHRMLSEIERHKRS